MVRNRQQTPPLQSSKNTSQARCSSLTQLGHLTLSFHSRGVDPHLCVRLPHVFSTINHIDIQQDIFSSDREPSLRVEFSDVTCQVSACHHGRCGGRDVGGMEFGESEGAGIQGFCAVADGGGAFEVWLLCCCWEKERLLLLRSEIRKRRDRTGFLILLLTKRLCCLHVTGKYTCAFFCIAEKFFV